MFFPKKELPIQELAITLAEFTRATTSDEVKSSFRKLLEESGQTGELSDQQILELLILNMFATTKAVNQVAKTEELRNSILDLYHNEMYKALSDNKDGELQLNDIVVSRYSEYYKCFEAIQKSSESWVMMDLGKTISSHVLNREAEGKDLVMIFSTTEILITQIKLTREFIEDITKEFELVTE